MAAGSTPKLVRVLGGIISAVPALVLLASAIAKFLKAPPIMKQMPEAGWPVKLILPLGILEMSCTILYLIPQTAVLGAILMTGYLGGAIATHVRIDQPFIAQSVLGVLVWLGLYFRDGRLRAMLPLRGRPS